MNETAWDKLDDDRVAIAAKRIIRQHQLQQHDRSEESVNASASKSTRAPDDPQVMRLALDDMGQAIEHMQRLLASREAVFMAALERIERNLAKTAGRIDNLADEIALVASKPALDVDAIIDDQRTTTLAVMAEFGRMMELGRSLLDEVRQVHAESREALGPVATSTARGT